ncbi:MAG: hypothetical protein VKK04_17950 [Synechococcales bacterium]|nr:hypothetical protein [Synechococcales bacterium]
MKRRLPLAIAGAIALSSSLLVSCSQPSAQTEGQSSTADAEVVEDSTIGAAEGGTVEEPPAMTDEATGDLVASTAAAEIEAMDQEVEALVALDPAPPGMGRLLKKQEAAHAALASLEAAGEAPSDEVKKATKQAIARYKRNLERVQGEML